MSGEALPLATMLVLGAWHGINPGMGWLFAVALGLQERKGAAVLRALPPLALGHALAVLAAVLAILAVGAMIPVHVMKWIVAIALLCMGVDRLIRTRHPRFGGMRVNFKDLTIWSLLMASAHGAGLMVVPFVLGVSGEAASGAPLGAHADHMHHASMGGMVNEQLVALFATGIHTLGYLLVTALMAWVVYRKLGLRLLRTHWVNLDLIWAGALIVTAVVTVVV